MGIIQFAGALSSQREKGRVEEMRCRRGSEGIGAARAVGLLIKIPVIFYWLPVRSLQAMIRSDVSFQAQTTRSESLKARSIPFNSCSARSVSNKLRSQSKVESDFYSHSQ